MRCARAKPRGLQRIRQSRAAAGQSAVTCVRSRRALLRAGLGEVDVRVIEARHHGASPQIHHRRGATRAYLGPDLLLAPHGNHPVVTDEDSLRPQSLRPQSLRHGEEDDPGVQLDEPFGGGPAQWIDHLR